MKLGGKYSVFALLALLASASLLSEAQETVGRGLSPPPKVSTLVLLNDTHLYDGKEVIFLGEVIGSGMERGSNTWINVHDGDYGIGIYVPTGLISRNTVYGDYHHKGDIVEVIGVFNRACKEHGGDMDIHAREVRLIANGYPVEHPISMSKLFFTLMLLGVNIILLIVLNRTKNGNN
ncbi:MAG: DNA-binding protein [Candidatus Altiarchaeota archaeon]